MSLFYHRSSDLDPLFLLFGLVVLNIIMPFLSLSYLGFKFNNSKDELDQNSYSKKTLIQIAFFNLFVIGIIFIIGVIALLFHFHNQKQI
jgi:TRAP-type mannitol/chloroaromatic compound transport system permease small subunit